MSVTPTVSYPGVYIQEVPSGVRTITGVATSITAFIGRALRGTPDEPETINSFADFERIFGGLCVGSSMSYAVRDFYLNGGKQAIIVRLYHKDAEPSTATLTADTLTPGAALTLEAASPGSWGRQLRARVDHNTRPLDPGEAPDSLFNLTIRDGVTGQVEEFRNLSITEDHPRQVDKVLLNESKLARMTGNLPPTRPLKSNEPSPGQDPWGDNTPATNYVATEASDGSPLDKEDFVGSGKETKKEGLYALQKAGLFNLLCIPPHELGDDIEKDLVTAAAKYCEDRRAMFLVDPSQSWKNKEDAKKAIEPTNTVGTESANAALFFPRLKMPNPQRDNQLEDFVPCGAVAGIFARTDSARGVWKAPAGLDANLVGMPRLTVSLTDAENGELNPLGINCLRVMPAVGPVVWGSRTLKGNDRFGSQWKYIPVRRMALHIEESLYRNTQWVVFEPNDEPLWAQIRLNIGAFMHNLFRQGAFQGKTPQEAYFVKCDKETTTQDDINRGIVNILVGFAPLRPAEFVVIKISQMAGQIRT